MHKLISLSAFVSLALVCLLRGNPPIPHSGVQPRCTCECALGDGSFISFPPDRPQEAPKKDATPTLIARCQFGEITQLLRKFTISGNDSWTADGEISADGKTARLTWFQMPQGRAADGQYAIDEKGELRGVWRWLDEVQYDQFDKISNGNGEWLHKVTPPPMPGFDE